MALPDRTVEHLARRQHGAFNIAQARSAGFTSSMIRHRVRVGAWIRKARGVYVLAAVRPTWEQTLMIAVLSQPDAAVSHHPGAALHRVEGFARCKPQLVVPTHANHRSPLAVIHRSDDVERTVIDGIPVVTLMQSLFDVAGTVPLPVLFRGAEEAVNRKALREDRLADRFIQLAPKFNRGIGDMRVVVERLCDIGFVPAQTELESLLFDLLDELSIDYDRQFVTEWRAPTPMIVDAFAPSLGLIAEADGRTWHARLDAYEADRHRDNAGTAHGFHTMRFTHTMLTVGRDQSRADLSRFIRSRQAVSDPVVLPIEHSAAA
jgi:very-short-patch-repair endonuclease